MAEKAGGKPLGIPQGYNLCPERTVENQVKHLSYSGEWDPEVDKREVEDKVEVDFPTAREGRQSPSAQLE